MDILSKMNPSPAEEAIKRVGHEVAVGQHHEGRRPRSKRLRNNRGYLFERRYQYTSEGRISTAPP
jgi:hypothetical protein